MAYTCETCGSQYATLCRWAEGCPVCAQRLAEWKAAFTAAVKGLADRGWRVTLRSRKCHSPQS